MLDTLEKIETFISFLKVQGEEPIRCVPFGNQPLCLATILRIRTISCSVTVGD